MGKNRKQKHRGKAEVNPDETDLDRFAGSSDEEVDPSGHGADYEDNVETSEDENSLDEKEQDVTVYQGKENNNDSDEGDSEPEMGKILRSEDLANSSAKMANAMARILGTSTKSSVILSKTTTPLQRMQKEEKDARKALKVKRQMKKERNLNSLHVPLSVATTFTVEGGGRLVAKELEQERFHRRVATRGVVALFNAISSHQKSTQGEVERKRKGETPKMTKHGFLDKIKSAAAAASSSKVDEKKNGAQGGAKWDALKENYLMDTTKNWDQDSSEDESNFDEIGESEAAQDSSGQSAKKKRRIGARE